MENYMCLYNIGRQDNVLVVTVFGTGRLKDENLSLKQFKPEQKRLFFLEFIEDQK